MGDRTRAHELLARTDELLEAMRAAELAASQMRVQLAVDRLFEGIGPSGGPACDCAAPTCIGPQTKRGLSWPVAVEWPVVTGESRTHCYTLAAYDPDATYNNYETAMWERDELGIETVQGNRIIEWVHHRKARPHGVTFD